MSDMIVIRTHTGELFCISNVLMLIMCSLRVFSCRRLKKCSHSNVLINGVFEKCDTKIIG